MDRTLGVVAMWYESTPTPRVTRRDGCTRCPGPKEPVYFGCKSYNRYVRMKHWDIILAGISGLSVLAKLSEADWESFCDFTSRVEYTMWWNISGDNEYDNDNDGDDDDTPNIDDSDDDGDEVGYSSDGIEVDGESFNGDEEED